jgi:hypothetical protein
MVSFDLEKARATITAIYPNPAGGIVNIQTCPNMDNLVIQLISQTGKVVLSKNLNTSGTSPMDVSAVPPGIYIIKTSSGEVHKLIKQ